MKRLAVFCDGTWNDLRMPARTNVARLAKCVAEKDPAGVQQVVYYDAGVGVPAGVSRIADWLIGVAGGAFGRGLDEKIEAAYRFLVLNYAPGDEIYVFGFSRGAYTARSLCGLIRKCGIVRRDCFDVIPEAMRLYRTDIHPEKVKDFRARYGKRTGGAPAGERDPRVAADALGELIATGREDLGPDRDHLWRARYGASKERLDQDHDVYRLMYLGLWDTVGSLGVPARFKSLARLFNARYRFHDTNASSLMTHLRHAVAVNEDRQVFDVTPVSNIEALNRDWADAMGRSLRDVPYAERPYQQRWFPGDHGAVGGGNREPGLSSGALLWIADGAEAAGLALNRVSTPTAENELAAAERLQAPLAEWRLRKDRRPRHPWEFDLLGMVGGYADRHGPETGDEVHESTWRRIVQSGGYYPRPLSRFTGKLWGVRWYRITAAVVFPVFLLLVLAALSLAVVLLGLALIGLPADLQALWSWARG